jgi:hypothetical protein
MLVAFSKRHFGEARRMKSLILLRTFLVIAGLAFQSLAPNSAGQATQPSVSGVLTLPNTLTILTPLISKTKAAARAGASRPFKDPASAVEVDWAQSSVDYSSIQPCLVTWDETTTTHYSGGRTDSDRERHFIWLPYLEVSNLKVMDLKSWTKDDDADSSVPESSDGTYSGFILTTPHSAQVIAVYPMKDAFPNPSEAKTIRKSEKMFFSNQSDAESAKQLLIHAATILTDPKGRPDCVKRKQ